jgi:hypothetical protein
MEQTNFWAPSTVFNRFGSLRCEDEYRSNSGWRMALTCATEKIAKRIEQLGYAVTCGYGGNGGWIILAIHKHSSKALPGGKLVYGIMNSLSESQAQRERSLSGNRTIYEAAKAFCPEKFTGDYSNLRRSVDGVFTEKKIKDLIERGSRSNQISKDDQLMETYLHGVSTIGNTLPADIVEALRMFTSTDESFVNDPDYEFYIPPSMQELPEACPCPEGQLYNLGGGGAAGAVAAVAAVAACGPAGGDLSSGSESDDESAD